MCIICRPLYVLCLHNNMISFLKPGLPNFVSKALKCVTSLWFSLWPGVKDLITLTPKSIAVEIQIFPTNLCYPLREVPSRESTSIIQDRYFNKIIVLLHCRTLLHKIFCEAVPFIIRGVCKIQPPRLMPEINRGVYFYYKSIYGDR